MWSRAESDVLSSHGHYDLSDVAFILSPSLTFSSYALLIRIDPWIDGTYLKWKALYPCIPANIFLRALTRPIYKCWWCRELRMKKKMLGRFWSFSIAESIGSWWRYYFLMLLLTKHFLLSLTRSLEEAGKLLSFLLRWLSYLESKWSSNHMI